MYNYLYDGQQHSDTSLDYLTKLGMDEASIESLQRAANDYKEQQYADFVAQRDVFLNESDWIIMRQKDQRDLGMGTTTLSYEGYRQTLEWRQQLRDMPEQVYQAETIPDLSDSQQASPVRMDGWQWPAIPEELKPEFPDYPPGQG